jgi:hypothetical protein
MYKRRQLIVSAVQWFHPTDKRYKPIDGIISRGRDTNYNHEWFYVEDAIRWYDKDRIKNADILNTEWLVVSLRYGKVIMTDKEFKEEFEEI